MSDYDSIYQRSLHLSPDQRDLLFAALASSNHFNKDQDGATMNPGDPNSQHSPQNSHRNGSSGPELLDSPSDGAMGSTRLGLGTDDSPFLDFDLDPEFDFSGNGAMIGDLPGTYGDLNDSDIREKRKSLDEQDDPESGKKRKENDDKIAKKPGRKPLMSEPTSKRKAQNRAAQRAFRDRKEKHLKDLETKVEGLEKASQAVNNENSMLRSQVDRLQLELKEYRKRLSWVSSGNSISQSSNPLDRSTNARNRSRLSNEFTFEFPKFGDVSNSQRFGNGGSLAKTQKPSNTPSMPAQYTVPGGMRSDSANGSNLRQSLGGHGSAAARPAANGQRVAQAKSNNPNNVDMQGLYEFLTASNNRNMAQSSQNGPGSRSKVNYNPAELPNNYPFPTLGASDSPSASSESQHGHMSSIGTSPEPMPNSPQQGKNNNSPQPQNGENQPDEYQQAFYTKLSEACGCPENPVPAALSGQNQQSHLSQQETSLDNGLDWLAQQNGGQFDPALFGDYRESQDAVLSQDFGSFFDDAFPFQSFDLSAPPPAPKPGLIDQIDSALSANDQEVVPAEDRSKMLSCPRIWDRLQSMEKFRSGEIDVDNLCTELKTKARCSEGGVVVNQNDVEEIMTRAK